MIWPISDEMGWIKFANFVAKKALMSNHKLLIKDQRSWAMVRNAYASILPVNVHDHLSDSRIRWVIHYAKRHGAANRPVQSFCWTDVKKKEAMRMARQRRDNLLIDL